jgi:hypothetical protein
MSAGGQVGCSALPDVDGRAWVGEVGRLDLPPLDGLGRGYDGYLQVELFAA